MSVNDPRLKDLTREIKHIGSRVMDIYKGSLTMDEIFDEIIDYLEVSVFYHSPVIWHG